jgi:hypothetical protein
MNNGKRYAVVVGVSHYHDDQIANLPCAKNDALRLAQALVATGEFKKDQVYLLANDVPAVPTEFKCFDPTRGNVIQKLQYVSDAAGPDDLILVFFAGHGVEVSKNPYLLSCDTMMDVLSHTGVKVADMNDILGKSKAKTILRIFDACRSSFGDTRTVMARMTKGFEDALMFAGSGWASLSSCSSGEVAHESGELNHGIFSYYLCEGLEGKAANDEGVVTFDRLVDYVRTSVGIWCDQQSQKQTPHLQSDLSGVVVLSVTKKAARVDSSVADNPFDALEIAIERHLAQTPRDARNLTFTDAQELETVSKTAQTAIRALADSFHHPALTLSVSERKPLDQLDGPSWNQLHQDMGTSKLNQEFTNNTSAVMIEFNSAEVVIPRTKVAVAVVRFSFFYWIWYHHVCIKDQLQNRFAPSPPTTKGFFTFKPKAASDGRKLDMTLRELFKRCSADLLSWSEQLKEFVDGRIDPLRKVGTIIE